MSSWMRKRKKILKKNFMLLLLLLFLLCCWCYFYYQLGKLGCRYTSTIFLFDNKLTSRCSFMVIYFVWFLSPSKKHKKNHKETKVLKQNNEKPKSKIIIKMSFYYTFSQTTTITTTFSIPDNSDFTKFCTTK